MVPHIAQLALVLVKGYLGNTVTYSHYGNTKLIYASSVTRNQHGNTVYTNPVTRYCFLVTLVILQ